MISLRKFSTSPRIQKSIYVNLCPYWKGQNMDWEQLATIAQIATGVATLALAAVFGTKGTKKPSK